MTAHIAHRARVIITLFTTEQGKPAFHVAIKGSLPREKAIRRALVALWHQATHLYYQP